MKSGRGICQSLCLIITHIELNRHLAGFGALPPRTYPEGPAAARRRERQRDEGLT